MKKVTVVNEKVEKELAETILESESMFSKFPEEFVKVLDEKLSFVTDKVVKNERTVIGSCALDFLIDGEVFSLPLVQRAGNQWKQKAMLDFLTTIKNNEPLPLFALGVLGNEVYLLDGQQRLNTSAWLYEVFSNENIDCQYLLNFEVPVAICNFESVEEMNAYYLRINASSGLTSAQKLKAQLSLPQLELFNKVAYQTYISEILQKTSESKIGDSDALYEYTYNGKIEEMVFQMLSICVTNKLELSRGFSTGVAKNFSAFKKATLDGSEFATIQGFLLVIKKAVVAIHSKYDVRIHEDVYKQGILALMFCLYRQGIVKNANEFVVLLSWLYQVTSPIATDRGKRCLSWAKEFEDRKNSLDSYANRFVFLKARAKTLLERGDTKVNNGVTTSKENEALRNALQGKAKAPKKEELPTDESEPNEQATDEVGEPFVLDSEGNDDTKGKE